MPNMWFCNSKYEQTQNTDAKYDFKIQNKIISRFFDIKCDWIVLHFDSIEMYTFQWDKRNYATANIKRWIKTNVTIVSTLYWIEFTVGKNFYHVSIEYFINLFCFYSSQFTWSFLCSPMESLFFPIETFTFCHFEQINKKKQEFHLKPLHHYE